MSSLSLRLAIERLPASVRPQPDPPDLEGFDATEELKNNINRVLERLHSEGKWSGLITQAQITAYEDANENKFITLPRHLETCIRGGQAGYRTLSVQSEWYQYLPQGRGIRKSDAKYFGPIQDIGEGYVTFRDLETPSQLTLSSSETECAGSYMWIRGKDSNGNKIYSTVEFVLTLETEPKPPPRRLRRSILSRKPLPRASSPYQWGQPPWPSMRRGSGL
jgi:hypothetical protein